MEFNKETFEKALKANKTVRYQQHFEAVVKSYLEIENQALRQPVVIKSVCEHDWYYSRFINARLCLECNKHELL